VSSVAITNAVPLGGGAPGTTRFEIEGRIVDDPERRPSTDARVATPQYFATLGIPVMAGRVFNDLDNEESMRVAVINKSMTRYWDGTDPVGSRIRPIVPAPVRPGQPPPEQPWFTVIGVVGDVRQFGLAQEAVAQLYIPLTQSQFGIAGQVLVRTAGEPAAFGNVLRATVHAVDPNQPVENVSTLDDLRSEALAAPRLTATLLGVFAAIALLVTLAGIRGVIATSVQQRTKEFGLRMALGARRDSVLLMVVRQGLTLVAIGLVIGIGAALAGGRVLSAYLYSTTPSDPIIFAGVAAVFIAAGIVACLIPARRATTVDPLIALRAE
jgi:predicted permease